MDITEIKDQRLSTIIAHYFICKSCSIVDKEFKRSQKGYPCPNCGKPSDAARVFFSSGVASIVDLIQEFYHMENIDCNNLDEKNHFLAVMIFFTSLGEVLIDQFLIDFMRNCKFSEEMIDKILNDNQAINKKMDLYKALTGTNFSKDLASLNSNCNFNFTAIYKFYREVRDVRNKILHKGYTWLIPKDMPKNCVKNVHGLLNLFVRIHNKHIAKI